MPKDWGNPSIQRLIDTGWLTGHLDGNHGELYPKAEEFSLEGVPYISANNFSNGIIDFEQCKKLPLERAKSLKKA